MVSPPQLRSTTRPRYAGAAEPERRTFAALAVSITTVISIVVLLMVLTTTEETPVSMAGLNSAVLVEKADLVWGVGEAVLAVYVVAMVGRGAMEVVGLWTFITSSRWGGFSLWRIC